MLRKNAALESESESRKPKTRRFLPRCTNLDARASKHLRINNPDQSEAAKFGDALRSNLVCLIRFNVGNGICAALNSVLRAWKHVGSAEIRSVQGRYARDNDAR